MTINRLLKELKKGEKSGFIQNFDRKEFVKSLKKNHLSNRIKNDSTKTIITVARGKGAN